MKHNAMMLTCSMLVLTACKAGTPPPAISYDRASFKEATIQAEPARPVEIVEVPKPLPLPGQLMPLPGQSPADKLSPEEQVETANKAALLEPSKHGYINAVQVYPYSEGALYRLYGAPGQVTDIALQPGEQLRAVSAGDTVRWVIGDTTSGSGDEQQVHILIKPFAPALKTNLMIATDRRTYHLQMLSTEETAMAAISWSYPQDRLVMLRRRNVDALAAQPVDRNLALEKIRFGYEIEGDHPPWRPIRAFDDGRKVYIEFPEHIDRGEVPPLFVISANGDTQLVNYRKRGTYYIVDQLFRAAELRMGTDPQQVVRITHLEASGGGDHHDG
ncbi:P-type conjugative transfer protein TrbG [Thalassospira indica]|jgi:type IV secretion system protein VirB9|uniref:P-type conjugative transfer protein TrbG n=1 Tax=Thalassospira indica TaxID=1891279 RepID=A0ABM6XWS6_9PROT|nr:P-type conjugative transfer protein TrbG [Thalassospira indica]AXO14132.1 P-type conjugative transfer protein TrbG [Thalassospira indica]OAZ12401.1 conjugal transfer protein TrbG [Thalassospira profundimaris]